MKKLLIFLLLLFIIGCTKDENLEKDFKGILVDYQKKFPIPADKTIKRKRIYIYIQHIFGKNNKIQF